MLLRYVNSYSERRFRIIVGFACIAVAVSLASSIYGFYEKTNRLEASLNLSPAASAQKQSPLDTQSTLSAGWFGKADEPSQNASSPAPNMELKGISTSDKTKLAGAYIAETGKAEAFYREGDELPSGAGRLAKVYSDHVTIDRAGSNYSLAFPPAKAEKPSDSQ